MAEVLKGGGVALISTDTVCGLAALPGRSKAIEKIYKMKKRDLSKPLALLIPSVDWVWKWVEETDEIKEICAENWPGAVTLIMNTRDNEKIGLRMPDCAPLLQLMEITGPLCATSANISGRPAPVKVGEADKEIKRESDIVEDFDVNPSGKPSRVIDITAEDERIIRE